MLIMPVQQTPQNNLKICENLSVLMTCFVEDIERRKEPHVESIYLTDRPVIDLFYSQKRQICENICLTRN